MYFWTFVLQMHRLYDVLEDLPMEIINIIMEYDCFQLSGRCVRKLVRTHVAVCACVCGLWL